MNRVSIEIESCLDCPDHDVRPDPDPVDWFCDDDKKVICCYGGKEKDIIGACRPYELRKWCQIPDWCPRLRGAASGD